MKLVIHYIYREENEILRELYWGRWPTAPSTALANEIVGLQSVIARWPTVCYRPLAYGLLSPVGLRSFIARWPTVCYRPLVYGLFSPVGLRSVIIPLADGHFWPVGQRGYHRVLVYVVDRPVGFTRHTTRRRTHRRTDSVSLTHILLLTEVTSSSRLF